MSEEKLMLSGVRGIIWFCAVECELQMSGERSVAWMLDAWEYAQDRVVRSIVHPLHPSKGDVVQIGMRVEPSKNDRGFRQVGVRVGPNVKMDWELVPAAMAQLCSPDAFGALKPAEWFRQYEEIHPFRDGNGRTGQILFNWLSGTLDKPKWAPNFWDDPRRHKGEGA